jgi:hypothetical protein
LSEVSLLNFLRWMAGWWFGTFFHILGIWSSPTDELIFSYFSEGQVGTTKQIILAVLCGLYVANLHHFPTRMHITGNVAIIRKYWDFLVSSIQLKVTSILHRRSCYPHAYL